jgi:hypothetical protein
MRASSTAAAVVLIATLSVVGCSQSTSPTVPSSASSVASSALGPGASYNASGPWHFVFTDVHGNFDGDFDADVHQDENGNLSFLDNDDFLVKLERLGTGVIITYRNSQIDDQEHGGCAFRVTGTARLDTTTNTFTMPYRLKVLDCSNLRAGGVLTGTKF